MYYIGLDVHKKTISCWVKDASGQVHEYARKACELLAPLKSSFNYMRQRFAKAQLLARDFTGASDTLDEIVGGDRNEWWHYWRSKAYLGLQKLDEALVEIGHAIDLSKKPVTTFFALRLKLEKSEEIPGCVVDLRAAIDIGVGNLEYEQELCEWLKSLEARFNGKTNTDESA